MRIEGWGNTLCHGVGNNLILNVNKTERGKSRLQATEENVKHHFLHGEKMEIVEVITISGVHLLENQRRRSNREARTQEDPEEAWILQCL